VRLIKRGRESEGENKRPLQRDSSRQRERPILLQNDYVEEMDSDES